MSAFVKFPGAPTKDMQYEGILYRYCGICDAHYVSGWWKKHRETSTHIVAQKEKDAMTAWYKANGSS